MHEPIFIYGPILKKVLNHTSCKNVAASSCWSHCLLAATKFPWCCLHKPNLFRFSLLLTSSRITKLSNRMSRWLSWWCSEQCLPCWHASVCLHLGFFRQQSLDVTVSTFVKCFQCVLPQQHTDVSLSFTRLCGGWRSANLCLLWALFKPLYFLSQAMVNDSSFS